MAQGPTGEFGEVFVVRETETALLCRIGEKSRVVHGRLQPGSTVQHPGDLGVLVLPWDFAVEFWDGAIGDKRRRRASVDPECNPKRSTGRVREPAPCSLAWAGRQS